MAPPTAGLPVPQPLGVAVPETEVLSLLDGAPLPLASALALLVTEPARLWLAASVREAEPVGEPPEVAELERAGEREPVPEGDPLLLPVPQREGREEAEVTPVGDALSIGVRLLRAPEPEAGTDAVEKALTLGAPLALPEAHALADAALLPLAEVHVDCEGVLPLLPL